MRASSLHSETMEMLYNLVGGVTETRLTYILLDLLTSALLFGRCGGLNENGPHRLIYLKVWVPVGGTVWEGPGCVTFGVSKAHSRPKLAYQSLCLLLPEQKEALSHCSSVLCPCPAMTLTDLPSETINKPHCPRNFSSISCLGHISSQRQNSGSEQATVLPGQQLKSETIGFIRLLILQCHRHKDGTVNSPQ